MLTNGFVGLAKLGRPHVDERIVGLAKLGRLHVDERIVGLAAIPAVLELRRVVERIDHVLHVNP
jgi:hypothetical protein